MVTSGYGRTLLVKSGLIAVGLLLALAARQRALPANREPRLPLLRRLTLFEGAALAAALAVAAVLVNAAPPRTAAANGLALAALGPPPVAGPSLQLADLAGKTAVSLTAGARELQFAVVPVTGQALGEVRLTANARRPDGSAVDLLPRSCGTGCFSSSFSLSRGITIVSAEVSSSKSQGGLVRFTIPWPLGPERPQLVRRVAATMRAVRLVTVREVRTGILSTATTHSVSGRQFMASELLGGPATETRQLGRRGSLTEIALSFPYVGSYIWYRIWVDGRYRLRRELIVAGDGRLSRTFSYGRR